MLYHYSNAADIRQSSGIRHSDIGFGSEGELDAWIESRLAEITDVINRRIDPKYQGEDAPAGVHGIARQMGINILVNLVATRNSPTIRVDDWNVRVQQATVLTGDVKAMLKLYAKRPLVRVSRVPGWREAASNE